MTLASAATRSNAKEDESLLAAALAPKRAPLFAPGGPGRTSLKGTGDPKTARPFS